MRYFYLTAIVLWAPAFGLLAQTPKDATVPLLATLNSAPLSVTLTWPNPAPATLSLMRRVKGAAGNQWLPLLSQTNSSLTTFTDTLVQAGVIYEYVLRRAASVNASGYAHVAVFVDEIESRGQALLLIGEAIADPLAPEIARFKADLAGDGWTVREQIIAASASVSTVKSLIISHLQQSGGQLQSVVLLGEIPVPYSGNTAWDGHPEHNGAWPADAYYGDLDGAWTDFSINNPAPARDANKNVPGDGKFDQSFIPSPIELQIGRIDFRRLSTNTFGASQLELYRRYLDKNHLWRSGAYATSRRALVDDNFGYFNGEAFAANGYRNAYPLVGPDSVIAADFIGDSQTQRFLMGYGTGPGSYQSAGGIGNSTQLASSTIHIVFSNLFGSYHGDWDFETNPFMPSALASQGGILTCAWAGRPHHFYQHLASGQTIGYCIRETQNSPYNSGHFNSFGSGGAHVALLGDPNLRANIVKPPSALSAQVSCDNAIELAWTPSPDPEVNAYSVYAATQKYGPYAKIATINGANTYTAYGLLSGPSDSVWIQVRALRPQSNPGGGVYVNNSTGVFTDLLRGKTPVAPSMAQAYDLNCAFPAQSFVVPAGRAVAWQDSVYQAGQTILIVAPGDYPVSETVSGADCTLKYKVQVTADFTTPNVQIATADTLINCLYPEQALTAVSDIPQTAFFWTFGVQSSTSNPVQATEGGLYSVVATAPNGCTATAQILMTANFTVPSPPSFEPNYVLTCEMPTLAACVLVPNDRIIRIGNTTYQPGDTACLGVPGIFSAIVETHLVSGCQLSYIVTVQLDINAPIVAISPPGAALTCTEPSATLTAQVSPSTGIAYLWYGPDGAVIGDTPSITVAEPGVYVLVATNTANGCANTASAMVVADTVNPTVSLSVPLTCCIWADSLLAPLQVLLPPTLLCEPGVYSLNGISTVNGCPVVVLLTLLPEPPVPPTIIVTNASGPMAADGEIRITNIFGGVPPYTVVWSNGQTGWEITGLPPGTYQATITDSNGCKQAVSVQVSFGTAQHEPAWAQGAQLFPNPTGGLSAIRFIGPTPPGLLHIRLLDAEGRLLRAFKADCPQADCAIELDLRREAPGAYWILVRDTQGLGITRKVWVAR